MLRAHFVLVAIVIFTVFGSREHLFAGEPEGTAAKLPRYKLEPGQKFEYAGKEHIHSVKATDPTKTDDWDRELKRTIWVLRKSDDGSVRCLVRISDLSLARKNLEPSVRFCYVDIDPQGNFVPNESINVNTGISSILPLLPKNDSELKNGWSRVSKNEEATFKYKQFDVKDPNVFTFEATATYPLTELFKSKTTDRFEFDVEQGYVTSFEEKYEHQWILNDSNECRIDLVSITKIESDELAKLYADSHTYFWAFSFFNESLKAKRIYDVDDCEDRLKETKKRLTDAKSAIKSEAFSKQIDTLIRYHAYEEESLPIKARRYAAFIGKPAPDWELEGLNGKKHKLSDYKGKVLVYEFWYRGCGYCMKGFPGMMKVVDHYKDKPVAVLGMNVDEELEDAQFIEKNMQLNFLSLQAKEIRDDHFIRGCPATVIVDRAGKIRSFHVGYSAQAFERLTSEIDKLLAE